jgi:hypothetical protein
MGEQAEVIGGLAAASVKQTAAIQRIAGSLNDQTSSAAEILSAVNEIRAQTRELTAGIGMQTKGSASIAADAASIAQQIGKIRNSSSEQLKNLSSVSVALEGRPRGGGEEIQGRA